MSAEEPSNVSTVDEMPAVQGVSTINSDDEFVNEMGKIKKLLNIDGIDELKPSLVPILRGKIMSVLKYVMNQIKAEEAAEPTEEAPSEEEASPVPSSSGSSVQQPGLSSTPTEMKMEGGRTGRKNVQKGSKQKGGWGAPMDLARITNTTEGGLSGTKDPYSAISGTPDVAISANLHKAFTSGNKVGFSSVDGISSSYMNSILPNYGTSQSGGAKKKRAYKKKN